MLGFAPSVLWPPDDPTFVILERDAASVGFFSRDTPSNAPDPAVELYIRVADAGRLHARLAERVPVEWGPEVYSYGCEEFAIRDPDGYLDIFTEPTDDEPTTHEPDAGPGGLDE